MTQLFKINKPINIFSFKRKPSTKIIKTNEQLKEEKQIEKNALKDLMNINMKTIRNEKARQTRRLKKLMKSQPIYENNEEESINDIMNIGTQPIISYKESNDIKQQKIMINNVMKQLKAQPTNWELDIETLTKQLNDVMKAYFYRQLHQFFIKTIGRLDTTNKYFIKYFINGSWRSKSYTGEEYNKLLNDFLRDCFVYGVEEREEQDASMLVSDAANSNVQSILLYSKIQFVEMGAKNKDVKQIKFNNDIGGSFFKYLIKRDAPRRVIQYLNRLQIFDRLYGVDYPHLYEKALLKELSY